VNTTYPVEFIGGPFDGRRAEFPLLADGPARTIEFGIISSQDIARHLLQEAAPRLSPDELEQVVHAWGLYVWESMRAEPDGSVVDRYRWAGLTRHTNPGIEADARPLAASGGTDGTR